MCRYPALALGTRQPQTGYWDTDKPDGRWSHGARSGGHTRLAGVATVAQRSEERQSKLWNENEALSLYLLVKELIIKEDIDEAEKIFGKSVSLIVVFPY